MPQLMKILEYRDPVGDVMAARVPAGGEAAIEWGSSLTVRESQKAVFLRDGKAMCVFDPGRYTLTTQNIPVLTKFLTGFVYGRGNTPFLADVIFLSIGLFKDLKWGTRTGSELEGGGGIPFQDPVFKFVNLKAFGTCSVTIKDPVVFLSTQVKTAPVFRVGDIQDYLRTIIVEALVDTLGELGKSVVELPRFYREISAGIKALLADEFKTSGLEIVDLNIGAITPPPELQEAMNKRGAMTAIGNLAEYQQYQMGQAMPEMARSPAGMSAGLNVGAQLGMAMMVPQMLQSAVRPPQPTPGVQIIEGEKPDPFAKIKQLKELLDMGAITPEEFNRKKEELLKTI
ncbi:MAG: SPFH domain-containing protein [Planctomycetes bacterium]|nr:SPFH domain-containing protein [Planctomycetota bacterium]